jgi:hypothetical protein
VTVARPFAVAALAALLAAGCGGGNGGRSIPGERAQALLAKLAQVESRFDRGKCGGASSAVGQLDAEVRTLPRSVDSDVRRTLTDGVARLDDLVADCQPAPTVPETTPSETQTQTQTQTETAPSTTQPTQTQTQTTQTQTTQTQTTPGGGNGGTGTAPSGGIGPGGAGK